MSVDIFSENLDDPDDAPPWSEAVFARAEIAIGDVVLRPATGTLTKRGRPKLESPKVHINLRLDSDVVDHFKKSGPGWQSRVNEALRCFAGLKTG
jgi:uncharacterized protein (DUF4415 family)